MRTQQVLSALVLLTAGLTASADKFRDLWYDGNAEISTYKITEMRYGQPREGARVMVYVTEPMRLATHIRPDVKLPDNQKVEVIKLNDLRRFNTGIYGYSVMTSVFSAVEAKDGIPSMSTMKVAFTQQDWYGTVFEETLRRDRHYENRVFSYFESEGTDAFLFAHGDTVEAEENLWILVRELRGELLPEGGSKKLSVIPSSWSRRKAHAPPSIVAGILLKGKRRPLETEIGHIWAHPLTWLAEGKKTLFWVEKAYPHRILAWEEPDGSSGQITASRREPYWNKNRNRDQYLRGLLKLSPKFSGT